MLKTICSFVVLVSLAACAESQPPLGAPAAMPQSPAIATEARRDGSWTSGTSGDLLYVSENSAPATIYVYTWPGVKLLNTFRIPGTNYGGAECADPSGDIFVTSTAYSGYGSTIYEYAHGGTTPIASLSDPGQAFGCAVDPQSGNLAVANRADFTNPNGTSQGDLALYVTARGAPTMLYAPQSVNGFESCAYDKQSDLYVAGSDSSHLDRADLLRLPSGESSFESITVNKQLDLYASLQWQGKRLMVSSWPGEATPVAAYRLSIKGSTAKVTAVTQLQTPKNKYTGQVLIQDSMAIGTDFYHRGNEEISLWAYPKGGTPLRNVPVNQSGVLLGAAISSGR